MIKNEFYLLSIKHRVAKIRVIGTLIVVISLINLMGCEISRQHAIDKQALKISDGSHFQTKQFFPTFSWQTTPMYYMFGDTNNLLTPAEVEFIAKRTGFLTIEKSHGFKPLGGAELGTKHEIAAFKKVNPDIKALYYFNSAWAWPFTSFNKNFTPEKIDNDPKLKSYLITHPKTGELHSRGHYIQHTYAFDVLNPDFRQWWVDKVAKGVEISGADGAFIDQMHGFSYLRQDKKTEVQKAQGELIAALKNRLGEDKIVLGNNVHQDNAKDVFPSVDAIMFEHYKHELLSKENLLKDWDNMLRIAEAGKISIFRIGVEVDKAKNKKAGDGKSLKDKAVKMAQLSKEKLEYYLACYLIGAQPYSYFQYGWGWDLAGGSLYDYPYLQKPLGAPKGVYTRLSPNDWKFTREFEHASVWLDTESKKAKIFWNK